MGKRLKRRKNMSEKNKKICLEIGDALVLRDLRYSNTEDNLGIIVEISQRNIDNFYLRTDNGYGLKVVK
ncbi:MAG: hypothetical protein DRM99_00875 [Thermoplasmata archaeon]|nr:MAG: hypothetical protein DRM99_00875 [Thermoplasmata archaeon]